MGVCAPVCACVHVRVLEWGWWWWLELGHVLSPFSGHLPVLDSLCKGHIQ